jgi:hypothetical protein
MNPQLLLPFAIVTSSLLCAQEKPAPQQPANPKTMAHEALATLVGDWQNTCKMAAMPGVPGMEKAQEVTGTEHTELLCNGLFLKSTIDSTFGGKPFQGMWLLGYDPFAKKYTSVWVSNQDEPDSIGEGQYDQKTKAWTFHGKSPQGDVRSTFVWKDADHSVETCFVTGPDGKETQCMEISRTRTKAPAAKNATAAATKAPTPEHALLLEGVGNWDAAVKWNMEGQPPVDEKCTEQVISICDGKWVWSTFTGQMMGAPFEGHGLSGYDATQKKYIGYWIDSMAPTWMRTVGTADQAKKTITCDGPCLDENGKPGTVHEVYTQTDKDNRTLAMTFKTTSGTMLMTIQYKRAKS